MKRNVSFDLSYSGTMRMYHLILSTCKSNSPTEIMIIKTFRLCNKYLVISLRDMLNKLE